jgi:exopolysaccharide production protein ExoQ
MAVDSKTPNANQPGHTRWLRDDRHSWLSAAVMWVLLVLMIVPEGFDYATLTTQDAPSSGSALSRALWLALLASGVLLVVYRARLASLLLRTLNPFLPLFICLAVASVAWSIDPSLTVRRLIRLCTIILVCAGFMLVSWHPRRFQAVVRPILTLMLAGSICFGLVFPALAIHQETSVELLGAWRGLASHKNGLGDLACMALILWIHAGLTREVRPWRAMAGGAIAVTCLALSRSSTSLLATVFVALILLVLLRAPRGLRPYLPHFVVTLVVMLVLYAFAVLDLVPGLGTLLAPITSLTDKGTTLTGRTQIWAIIAEHIRLHPFFGSGYAAYWTGTPTDGTDSYEFVRRGGAFYPGSAHNGYLEVVNDLGWVGFVCLLAYMLTYVRQSLQLATLDSKQAALYLALYLQQAITNLAESHWFSVLSVDFVIMTMATFAVARGLLDHRLRAMFGDPDVTVAASFATAARPLLRPLTPPQQGAGA